MKKEINYVGFLSLLMLIAILGWTTENKGLYGFLGFAYYLRYFWVIPDELFLLNVQKSATCAFILEMVSLVPLMFVCNHLYDVSRSVPMAFCLSYAVAIFSFTVSMIVREWKEQAGAGND